MAAFQGDSGVAGETESTHDVLFSGFFSGGMSAPESDETDSPFPVPSALLKRLIHQGHSRMRMVAA